MEERRQEFAPHTVFVRISESERRFGEVEALVEKRFLRKSNPSPIDIRVCPSVVKM